MRRFGGPKHREDYTWVATLVGVMVGAVIGTLYAPLVGTLVGSIIGGFVVWANFIALWSLVVE